MSQMTDEKCDWLLDNKVMICTSFDGPRDVHENNRHLARASSYDEVTRWIQAFNARYAARGEDTGLAYVNALMTVTSATLKHDPREVVDEYRRIGLKAIHLRPLNPFGFAKKTWERIGYTADEYLDWYRRALDYVIELNRGGERMLEKKLGLYLEKIFTDTDPNYMELRSPCGAGTGQMAYNHDGRVYTCDEGRMIGKMGDPIFEIGDVTTGSAHHDYVGHETVRAMAAASYLDSVPGCSDCAYNPYCGVCPIYNYVEQGDLFGKMPGSDWCKISMGVIDYLFGRLAREGDALKDLLLKWAEVGDRSKAYCVKPGSSMTY
jgi:His-Xaa-Ser system radical SAM maturase HxsB